MTLAETLAMYMQERKDLQDKSDDYSDRLSKAKFGKRGPIRRVLRKTKRSLRRMDRQIRGVQNEMRKEGKNDVQEVLAQQGIDGRSNQINAIGGAVAEVGKVASMFVAPTGAIGGALGGLSEGGITAPGSKNPDAPIRKVKEESNNTMLYVGGGVALLMAYMMMKK